MNNLGTKILLALTGLAQGLGATHWKEVTARSDALTAIFLVVAVLLVAFGVGKTRMMLAILSTYVAAFLQTVFPFFSSLAKLDTWKIGGTGFLPKTVVFAMGFALALFILNRSVLKTKMSSQEVSPLVLLWLSMTEVGFMLSLLFSYGHPENIVPSSWFILIGKYFSSAGANLFWAVLPLLSLFLLKAKRRPATG